MFELYGEQIPDEVGRAIQRLRIRTVRKARTSKEHTQAISKTIATLEKQFGKGVLSPIALMADRHDVACVSTGYEALDDIISGRTVRKDGVRKWIKGSGRGVPRARIVEIFGPESSGKTTLCLQLVKAFQMKGGVCAFIDAEHALDMDYADSIGCDVDSWYYSQGGDSAEATLSIVDQLVKDNVFDLVIIDSVAALTPQAELDGEVGDYHVGLHARLMSQALRKISANLKRGHRTLVVFVNQTRSKIGVRFGDPECVHADTPVPFVDGTSHSIREVVEEKLKGPIWAYNAESGFYPARIKSHHYNGKALPGDFVMITAEGVDTTNGILAATVSTTHNVLTERGWVKASQLCLNDRLVTKYANVISGQLGEFLEGVLCGDSTIQYRNRGASLRFQDSNNPDYVKWKRGLLAPYMTFRKDAYVANGRKRVKWTTRETKDLAEFARPFVGRNPLPMLRDFSWLAFAVWIMDDASYQRSRYTLSAGRFAKDQETQGAISDALRKQGLSHRWSGKNIVFDTDVSMEIAANIALFVPPSMQYKLPDNLKGGAGLLSLSNEGTKYVSTFVPVTGLRPASKRKYRDKGLYDLEVPNGHNYLIGNVANGFVVHNTTTGGNALKFYSTVRLRTSSMGAIKKGGEKGIRSKVKVRKTKIGVPHGECFLEITGADGITAAFANDPRGKEKGGNDDED